MSGQLGLLVLQLAVNNLDEDFEGLRADERNAVDEEGWRAGHA